jgi:hypothetical protein
MWELEKWAPPTKHLADLKAICIRMIEQDKLDWDDPEPSWYLHATRPPKVARAERLARLRDDLARREESLRKSQAGAAERVEFVRSLEAAFPRTKTKPKKTEP